MRRATQLMTADPIVVRPHETFAQCAQAMRVMDIRHLVVATADGKLAGLLPDTEVFERGRFDETDTWVPLPEHDNSAIADAVQPADALRPDTSIVQLLSQLLDIESDVVVVVDAFDVPLGIFTEHDALKLAVAELPTSIRVSEVMATSIVTAEPETPLEEVLADMELYGIRHMPVRDHGELIGVISIRDVLWAGASVLSGGRVAQTVDRDQLLMTTAPDATLHSAAQLMADCKVGCLPVLGGDGSLEGLVTATDVLKSLLGALRSAESQ